MKLTILKNIVIPAMRLSERELYCKDVSGKLYFQTWLEQNKDLSGYDKAINLNCLEYEERPPFKNYLQHPGYTLWKGSGICKDVAFLLHCFMSNSHYIEAWKDILNGHVFVVYSDYVYDFTSKQGLRRRHREFDNPIEAVKVYYPEPLFIQENFKIKSKYDNKIL